MPFANRWAGPYRVKQIVADESYRLELPVRSSSRMGRVFNAIELESYYGRQNDSAITLPRIAAEDRTFMDDFHQQEAQSEIELDETILAPNPALPRWQQHMNA